MNETSVAGGISSAPSTLPGYRWGAAERNTLAPANGARANAGFETITLPSEVALFKEQPAGGALG